MEYFAEAGPGDFIFVPPFVPHQEINADDDEPLNCIVVRSDQEPVVVNLDLEPAEAPTMVAWVDALTSRRSPPSSVARNGTDVETPLLVQKSCPCLNRQYPRVVPP